MLVFGYKYWLVGPIEKADFIIDNADSLSLRPSRRREDFGVHTGFNSDHIANGCVLGRVVEFKS